MSMRCLACNRPLEYSTLRMVKPETEEPEDMCGVCREKSYSEYNYAFDHSYEHETVTEGLSTGSKSNYYYDWND